MSYPPPARPEENPVLIELLRLRLARLNYLSFAFVVRRLFTEMGFTNVELLGRSADRGRTPSGGADMAASVESSLGKHRLLVQIKRHKHAIPRCSVDELRSVLLRRGVPQAIALTTGSFSRAAREAAAAYPGRPIRLIDGTELATLMALHRIGIREQANLVSGVVHWTIDEEAFLALRRHSLNAWALRSKRKAPYAA